MGGAGDGRGSRARARAWHDKGVLIRFIANAAALAVATWLVPGIWLADAGTADRVLTLLGVALIFGVVNTVVKPVFKLVTAPVILLTVGLFLVVVNGALLLLVSWLADQFGLAWHVDDLWSAVLGSLIVSVVSFILNKTGRKGGKR